MPTNVQVPGLGESVSEAVLIKWHKQDGEAVKTDEPIAELETDKANVDVPSPGNGVIKRSVPEGTKVRIGQTIATIDPDGRPSTKGEGKPGEGKSTEGKPTDGKPAASGGAKSAPVATSAPATTMKTEERLSPRSVEWSRNISLTRHRSHPPGPGDASPRAML